MQASHIKQILTRLATSGCALSVLTVAPASFAYEMADLGESTVNINVQAVYAAFHSERGYNQFGNTEDKDYDWQEGYLEYGFELAPKSFEKGGVYAELSAVTTATWGDGDAAGFTMGDENESDIEDAYLGYRHDGVMLGGKPWSLDVSAGSQVIQLGDGFLIASDAVNFGSGLGDDFNRGGAYYLAGRKAFDQTFLLKASNATWQTQLGWIESDNRAQANTELGIMALQHRHDAGSVELTYIRGLEVDEAFASPTQLERDGMDTYSLRFEQSLGNDNTTIQGEYAYQTKSSNENAWYLEPAYTFTDMPWQPTLTLRYSRFSEDWDPLFYGFTRGFGTWFQGEVAANYAGPFNSNTEVWHLGATAQPTETLSLGALYFDFDTLDTSNQPDMSGQEVNLYAEWFPSQHLFVMPLFGWYQPEKSASQGGVQLGDDDTNAYAQLIVGTFF
ncbi:alginate export family protein [Halomonas sediminis]